MGDLRTRRDLPRRRQWHPTLVLLPGKSHGWRSLVSCSPWGRQQSGTTERLPFHFHFHALEQEMASHSSVLAWRIPGTGEPSGLSSMGSHRVGHDWSDLAAAAAAAETYPDSSVLTEEADGCEGPLLVPKLWFFVQSSEGRKSTLGRFVSRHNCRLKKDAQLESCELSFIWGKMRTAAWVAASQIALRDCSKAAVGEGHCVRFWWRGTSIPLGTHFIKGFLLVMRIWCHHEGIYCFSLFSSVA